MFEGLVAVGGGVAGVAGGAFGSGGAGGVAAEHGGEPGGAALIIEGDAAAAAVAIIVGVATTIAGTAIAVVGGADVHLLTTSRIKEAFVTIAPQLSRSGRGAFLVGATGAGKAADFGGVGPGGAAVIVGIV